MPDSRDAYLLALIPAWNEAGRLEQIVRRAGRHLAVLVVDDGSTDDTALVAREAGAEVVSHPVNQGKGVALRTGFRWALDHDVDGVITLDADGQHEPDEIPAMVSAWKATGADLVIGRRDFSRMPFPRGHSNALGSWMLSRVLAQPIYDNQCGFRLYSKHLLETVDLKTRGFELEVEVIVEAVAAGLTLAWVDVQTIYGTGKASYFNPILDSARFLSTVWWARGRMAQAKIGRAAGRDSGNQPPSG